MTAKKLIRELQAAIDANGGNDMWVGLKSMDDYTDDSYGLAEYVSTHTSTTATVVSGMGTVVITYN